MYLKITLHSAAAEEIIKNYIAFLDPGGINDVIIVGPTVVKKTHPISWAASRVRVSGLLQFQGLSPFFLDEPP